MAAGIANIFDKGGPRVRLAHYEAADVRHAVALGPVHPLRKRGGRKTDGDGGQSEVAEQTGQEQRLSSAGSRSEEHTSELQSLMRISYAVFCLKKKTKYYHTHSPHINTYN